MNWLRVLPLLSLMAFALAQSNDNYFQIRYFSYWPSQIASSTWADRITLDAQVNWNLPLDVGRVARVGFSLSNTNLINQAIKLEGTADFGYMLLQYEGGIGGEIGARKNSLTGLLAYNLPRGDPQAVQLLSNVNLIYMAQADSAKSGYTLNFADFGLRGAFAQGWNWGAGYGFTQTSLNTQPLTTKTQQGRLEVRGSLSPLEIASNSQLRLTDDGTTQNTLLDQRLEGKLKMTDAEDLSLSYHLATQPAGAAPQSDATLSLNSSRPKPFSFGGNVGIRSPDSLTWGANTTYQDDSYSASLEYAGVGGSARDHSLQANLRYRTREWGWGLGMSTGAALDLNSGFWYGRVGGRIDANYKINPWNFSLRSSMDYQASNAQYPLSSSLDLKSSYAATGFRFDAGLSFSYRQDKLSGKANLTTLFGLAPNLDLNLSLDYLSLLTPVSAQQLGLGLGLRYGF